MRIIDKKVKELYKAIRGKVEIPKIKDLLETRGYSVVFFNTEEGDELLKAYNIPPSRAKAFTVCGPIKTVFIDDTIHASDKLYSLLHECGHILLGHLSDDKAHALDNRKNENDVEVFAYKVLNYKKYRKLNTAVSAVAIFATLLSVVSILACTYLYAALRDEKENAALESANTVILAPADTDIEEYVFVTATGTKYHSENCNYADNSAKMKKSEAEKIYDPCSICNP